VDPILERLLAAHLVEAVDSDRYRMHDLIRLFAREQAAAIPAAESTAAVTRVLRALLAAAVHATRLAYPRRTHYPAPERLEPTRRFAGPDDAGGWLEAASPQLIAMIRQSWAGPAEHVRLGLELTLALHWFLVLCSHSQDSVELNGHAVETAIQLGDRGAEAFARGALAFGLRETGRVPESTRQVRIELSICQEIGDRFGEQRASGNLGMSLLIEDRVEEAVGCLEHQRAVAREIDAPVGETYALLLLGRAYHMLGRHGDAIASLEAALAWCDEVGDDYLAGPALERLGLVRLDLGHVDLAREALQSSIERLGRSGYHLLRAEALISLACLWRRSGATGKALDCADAALEITEALGVYETSRQARAERTAALTAGS
jgi:tetratricopeptide (TPR) repeat protein